MENANRCRVTQVWISQQTKNLYYGHFSCPLLHARFNPSHSLALTKERKNTLKKNEVKTIYSYRLREYMQSIVWLEVRCLMHYLFSQLVVGQVFPTYEYFQLTGEGTEM